MPTQNRFAVMLSIAAVVVLAGAFMPWGKIHGASVNFPMNMPPQGQGFPFGGINPLEGLKVDLTITGWNGNIKLANLSLPNWLVVMAAAGIAGLAWLKALAIWSGPAAISFALAIYGALHAGFASAVLQFSQGGTVGIGSILTTLAFIGILVVLGQEYRKPLANNL
jgi:hypothetical protein